VSLGDSLTLFADKARLLWISDFFYF